MVGGRDFRSSPYNRAVLARRQPGSSFKPFVWLTALETGLTPDDTVLDAPIRVGNWSPADFERRYLGEITLEEALAQSINTASVRLLLRSGGARAVAATAARLGIADRLPKEASLALGTGEVGLLELTAAYAPFFNGGNRVVPFGLDGMAHPPERVIDPTDGGDDGADAGGGGQPRYWARRRGAGAFCRRKNRHDPGFSRRLVHRFGERRADRGMVR